MQGRLALDPKFCHSPLARLATGWEAWADWLKSAARCLLARIVASARQTTSEGAQATTARLGAHLAVMGLAVSSVVLSGARLPEYAHSIPLPPTPTINPGNRPEGLANTMRINQQWLNGETSVVRQALPLTPHISRLRKGVITYTVQVGDTIFGIAQEFNLQPETILWANPDLKGDPDLLSVGMDIAVPPVDGVIHVIQKGDTLDSLAQKYKVTPQAILDAIWNNLAPGQKLLVGKSLIVPGGQQGMSVWQLPSTTLATGKGMRGWTNAGRCEGVTPAPIGTGKFIWPTKSHQLGGNPYAGWHRGIDLSGSPGDPVYAADTGTVIWTGSNSVGYGLMIMLDHGNGWQTLYAHLSQVYVRCGQPISRGTVIGTVGSTGRSTGPHLHFETRLDGNLLNPRLVCAGLVKARSQGASKIPDQINNRLY